jgi:hypothetical protein
MAKHLAGVAGEAFDSSFVGDAVEHDLRKIGQLGQLRCASQGYRKPIVRRAILSKFESFYSEK